nr:putative ribonuclease H-like domain-containing protein [Tanacetum cinerariifolium]
MAKKTSGAHALDTAEFRSTGIFNSTYDDDLDIFTSLVQSVGAKADFNNMDSSTVVSPIPTHMVHIDHLKNQILGDPKSAVQTRGMAKKTSGAHALMEPKKVAQALDDERWVRQCKKSCFNLAYKRNKKDKRGIIVRNKARLVAQGHRQEEGIDYDEVFAPVARIESIRIFLAFASFMGFIVYQMDVKSAFLYGTIEEVVYVSQPPGFIDPQFPNKVYKVENAFYGLHQTPRAWFQVTPKISHLHAVKRIFRRLSISWQEINFIAVQEADIVATSTTKAEYVAAANCCGQIVDFLTSSSIHHSLTVSPTIYASNITQFWNYATFQTINDEKQIHAIVDGKIVVITESSVRRDLLYTEANGITCLTNEQIFKNLLLMGFIFDGMRRNLDGSKKKFLMYPRFLQIFLKNQIIDLVEPLNDVYVTPTLTKKVFSNMIRKSEIFFGTVTPLFATMLAPPAVVEGKGSGNPSESQPTTSPAQPINESQIPESSSSPKNTQSLRQTLEGTRGGDSLVRAATTASLDAQQDSTNITKTQSKVILIEPTPQRDGLGYTVGSGEDMMEHDIELTDPVPQTPHDLLLLRGHTPGSDEGSMTLEVLMDLYTILLQKVFDLENVKTAQAKEIASLKKRVTKLEQRQSSRFSGFHPFRAGSSKRHGLGRRKISKQGRKILKSQQMFQDIDDVLDEDTDTEMIVEDKGNGEKRGSTAETVSTARPEDSTAEPKTPPITTNLFDDKDFKDNGSRSN